MSLELSNISSSVRYLRWVIILFTVAVVATGGFLLQNLIENENERYADTVRSELVQSAASLRADIEQSLNQRLFLISGLRSFVVANDFDIVEEEFQEYAAALVAESEAVRSVQLAPGGIVTHIYPLAGNEAALGHNLLVDDVRRDSVYQAIEQNAYIVTGPITLLQGGNALIARQPIYQFASSTPVENRTYSIDTFWGFATVLVDVDVIYKVAENAALEGGYEVSLRGVDGTGSQGNVFYGNEAVFSSEPVLKEISLPVGLWELAVVPEGGWPTESPASYWLLIIGLASLTAFVALCGVILFSLRRTSKISLAVETHALTVSPRKELLYDSFLLLLIGGIVIYTLVVWSLGEIDARFFAGGALMNPLTAMSFGVVVLAIFFRRRMPLLSHGLLGLITGIVALRLAGILNLIEWQVDLTFFRNAIEAATVPARMSVNTTISFLLILGGIWLSFSAVLRRVKVPHAVFALVSILSGLVIFSFLFTKISVTSWSFFYSTSLPTAVLFFVLSLYMQLTITRTQMARIGERLLIFGGLIFCITVAALFANSSTSNYEQTARDDFKDHLEQTINDIKSRMDVYVNVLESGKGLFAASERVDRDEWRAFVTSLNLEENYPGIQGLGYAVFVSPEEKAEHEAAVQAEGFSNFAIHPEGERELYSSIIYLEPFDVRNQQAFGFDMFQEANRRSAMEAARDTGLPHASAKITLVQEIDNNVQAGFLVYVPQYENGKPVDSIDKRRNHIEGYVYSPFRMGDLMAGTLSDADLENIQFTVFDGDTTDSEALMYQNTDTMSEADARFLELSTIDVAGRTWTLKFVTTPDYGISTEQRLMPIVILLIGLLIGVLLTAMLFAILSSRHRAVSLAASMTEKLESAKNTLELATRSAGIGIWSWDIKENKLSWDEQMYALYGINERDFSGAYDAWQAGLHPDDKKMGDEAIQAALRGEEDFNITFRVLWPSGQVRYIRAHAMVERNEAGEPQKMMGVNFDVTQEVEVDKAKTEFVSLASHQLRTPLSAINWFAQMLEAGDAGELNEEQKVFIKQVLDSNQRMVELVDSLLNVSRIDLGTFAIDPKEIMLNEIADSVIAELEPKISEKQHTIERRYSEEVPKIMVDEKLTRIIFQNLISNAVKYTGEHGTITVAIKKNNEFVEISVEDTGYGIPRAQQDRVFEKLFRADNVREMETDGTGLGLYIIKAIAEEVGGKAWFESQEGVGTTFHVTIPLTGMKKKEGNKELD